MPLVRAWARGLSGASGVALLVPGGVIAAMLLLALAGSFGRLGGLGQAFTGPSVAGPTPLASSVHAPAGRAPALLPVATASATAVAPAVVANRVAPAASGVPKPPPASPPSRTLGGGSGGNGGGTPTAPSGPGAPSGSGGCGSCSPPPTHQTLVDQVVNVGTSVTSKLPGPVGQVTTQLLRQVGSTVDKILPTDRRANAVTPLGGTLSQLKLP
jgi:hypothetical protein